MLNNVVLCGRLTADVELRNTASGIPVTNFTLAVDRDFKNGDQKVADFIPIQAWRGTAEWAAKFIGKGRQVIVVGSLQSHSYEDKDGNKRTAYNVDARNIYFADSKKTDGQSTNSGTDFADADGSDLPF